MERETRDPVLIARRCQDAGAQVITLHPRTRAQMYSGSAQWDEIAAIVDAVDVPVIGNGDIRTADDVVRMHWMTGCAGVMVARGSFGQPWIFTEARALLDGREPPPAPPIAERFAIALRHARMAQEYEPDPRGAAIEFRKHLGWYVKGLPGSAEVASACTLCSVRRGRRRVRGIPSDDGSRNHGEGGARRRVTHPGRGVAPSRLPSSRSTTGPAIFSATFFVAAALAVSVTAGVAVWASRVSRRRARGRDRASAAASTDRRRTPARWLTPVSLPAFMGGGPAVNGRANGGASGAPSREVLQGTLVTHCMEEIRNWLDAQELVLWRIPRELHAAEGAAKNGDAPVAADSVGS